MFAENGRYHDNVTFENNNLLTQLKRRSSAIIRIATNFNIKFRFQLIFSLLIGKINYNLATWGNVNIDLKNKINNIISKTVEYTSLFEWTGKTLKWKMKKINIPTFFQLYRDSVAKFTFSVLNNKKNNFLAHSLTQNRNSRNLSQNKCGNSNDDILSDISKKII